MARMHSRKKGQSGSNKPIVKTKPSWLRYKANEIELLIVKLAKEGRTSSQIGIYLRDVYGIPYVRTLLKKRITQVMGSKGLLKDVPEDLNNLLKKYVHLQKHLEKNNHDMPAKRGLQLTDSKIKRLVKYYKKSGKLEEDWKFDPSQMSIYS
jgi:small subunit ribosomal protein S15